MMKIKLDYDGEVMKSMQLSEINTNLNMDLNKVKLQLQYAE